jgi:hypothetical protein
MNIIKPLINFGQLLSIKTMIEANITEEYYYEIILPALNKIADHNKIKIRNSKIKPFVIGNEIVVRFQSPYFTILCDHKYYDGKVISNLCHQLNTYIETNKLMSPIKTISYKNTFVKTCFNGIATNLINNKLLGETETILIRSFEHPIKASNIVDFVQKREQKPIIYIRASKSDVVEQGNTFNLYIIRKNQTLKEALSKEQIIKKQNYPELLINRNYILLNLYPHFKMPCFCEKMVLENKGPIQVIDKILGFIQSDSYLLTPKSSNNTHDLYKIQHIR